jgi:FkbM family methyltransferase
MKRNINKLLSFFDIRLTRASTFKMLCKKSSLADAYSLVHKINVENLENFINNFSSSRAEIAQDLFVLSELNFKRDGFFVEFGATNGINSSNSYLLEKNFGWKGILAEPAKIWHNELEKNRTSFIEKNCVWKTSNNKLTFNEAKFGELSTIDNYANSDKHFGNRKKGTKYKVNTISLIDLLEKYNAPKIIDYLSIDTEGSEYEILSSFNFDKYKFKVITCEHNFTSNRDNIFNLLSKKGYERKFADVSQFDDWYVLTKN